MYFSFHDNTFERFPSVWWGTVCRHSGLGFFIGVWISLVPHWASGFRGWSCELWFSFLSFTVNLDASDYRQAVCLPKVFIIHPISPNVFPISPFAFYILAFTTVMFSCWMADGLQVCLWWITLFCCFAQLCFMFTIPTLLLCWVHENFVDELGRI